MSGKSFPDVILDVYAGKIRVGGRRVIALHLGTNGICYKTWGGKMSRRNRYHELMVQVSQVYTAIRKFNSSCFIIFSSVLPRKCDWSNTKELCILFNQRLKQFCQEKKCGYMPTYTSFAEPKDLIGGIKKGDPLPGLWAVKDGGLHLNLAGRFLFAERFKNALHPKQRAPWLGGLIIHIGKGWL